MSWWREFEPSRPRPVADGVKTKSQRGKIGATWWASRWIETLETFTDSARLGRGRSYARKGQVVKFELSPGLVSARVQGSRATPYKVEIRITPLTDAQWEKVIGVMAEQAIFAAKLLSGEMPQDIEDAFRAAGVPLFPQKSADLKTDCSCPDWANPCKHIAALHYVLGDQFDDDPFLIFRLRGRERDAILDQLRALRAGGAEEPSQAAEETTEEVVPLDADPARFWGAAEDLAPFHAEIRPPAIEGALLKRLGPLPLGKGKLDVAALLAESYTLLSERALDAVYGSREPSP